MVRLGLLQPGPSLLCAVADPGTAAPVPRRPGSLAETGRGLHIICTLSDKWGYTTPPAGTGKILWALFTPTASAASTAGTRAGPADDRAPEQQPDELSETLQGPNTSSSSLTCKVLERDNAAIAPSAEPTACASAIAR